MDIIGHTKCLRMKTTLAIPVTVTLWGPSVLSVLRMISILIYTKENGQVSVHAREATQDKNVIAANLATGVTQPASPVTAVQLAA